MAAIRARTQLVGTGPWINDENNQVALFCAQEAEDFTFSARNEVEWLNEHMAEIFSKGQVNVTEIFKTPGKLRGKTPRTARKRNPLEVREPLTDIFSTNLQPTNSPSRKKPSPQKNVARFKVAEDPIDTSATATEVHKANTDSGYHTLPEDDMDVDLLAAIQSPAKTKDTTDEKVEASPLREPQAVADQPEDRTTADGSFHSAKEVISKEDAASGELPHDLPSVANVKLLNESLKDVSTEPQAPALAQESEHAMELDVIDKDLDADLIVDESRSPSQGSSPARPVRKSSLTFAALPAREPLTTKKSIGARVSRTSHLDQSVANLNRGSLLGRFTGGKSLGGLKQPDAAGEEHMNDGIDFVYEKPSLAREESDGDAKLTQLHNKSSTQRLHERINMLGKTVPARPTKSIPAAAAVTNLSYPELPTSDAQVQASQLTSSRPPETTNPQADNDEDDDDWIQSPPMRMPPSSRPLLPKSVTADVMEDIRGKGNISDHDFGPGGQYSKKQSSPLRQANFQGVQNNELGLSRALSVSQFPSTLRAGANDDSLHTNGIGAAVIENANKVGSPSTPIGSPSSKRYVDGPLSASKSRLQSIMKTARGLFSSSAGVSAQAKMETLSPPPVLRQEEVQGSSIDSVLISKPVKDAHHSPVGGTVGRKTRSSTEKEERRKRSEALERERAEGEGKQRALEPKQLDLKAPAEGSAPLQTKPSNQSSRRSQRQEGFQVQPDVIDGEGPTLSTGPPVPQQSVQPSHIQKPKDIKRPVKPAKETAVKPKPQPVAIRVGTLSQRIPLTNAALSSSLQESLPPPPPPKQSVMTKKASNASLQTSVSSSSMKGSVASVLNKPKALLAAERKKEQDEKEAQRKLEQKREIERKRAAQQEETRRQEQLQRQEAERQRERERTAAADDPKKAAQRQQIEKRRMEMNKKDQQRVPQRPVADPISALHAPPQISTTRQELGGARPPSRLHTVPDNGRPLNNLPAQHPAKLLNKRVFDLDGDDEPVKLKSPPGGPSNQPNESKRRKTEDKDFQEHRVRPTMAPPIRQSGIRKEGPKSSIFSSNYVPAPPPAPHHHNGPSLLKATTANQAYQQHAHQTQASRPGHHPDISKYTNGKIPFGDVPNPPQNHKTPLPSKLTAPGAAAKSSPQYINGENIHLEDIQTSDEDESDDDGAKKPQPSNLPEWAQSPQLRQLLMTQDEQMDADAVFGPVASPHMEEMFRERHHRFRSRTSSANWNGADRLTEEEIRRDVEARQRLRREGGWTFGL